MRKIIFLVGFMLIFSTISAYGQEDVSISAQSANSNNVSAEVKKESIHGVEKPKRTSGVVYPSVILSEICFLPKEGEPEWIELKNVADKPVDISEWQIVTKDEIIIKLPKSLSPVPPGDHVLIVLDGKGNKNYTANINDLSFKDDNLITLHTPPEYSGEMLGDVLRGECALYEAGKRNSDSIIHFVMWGVKPSTTKSLEDATKGWIWRDKRFAFPVFHGPAPDGSYYFIGPFSDIRNGGSIGIYAPIKHFHNVEWLIYEPLDTTPGKENILPCPYVGDMGGGWRYHPIQLSCMEIRGASGYHFQLCENIECTAIVLDIPNSEEPYYVIPEEAVQYRKKYYWRVRAVDKKGKPSRWSEVVSFYVNPPDK